MASATLSDPVVEQQQRGRTDESIGGRVLTACSLKYGRQGTLARLQSTKDRRELESVSILSRLTSPFVQAYNRFVQELNSFSLPFKAGLAASICSVLCFLPGPLSVFNSSGTWAVLTVDMVLETNVGFTFSQGINQTLGALAAVVLALLVNFFMQMTGEYEPYFLVFWVFFGGALATMFKFRPRFIDRWNLAVAISLIIFHMLILTKLDFKNKMTSPAIILVAILIGFLTTCLVNLGVAPRYAGSMVNELVAKNLERAGNVMERCVIAYCEGMVLEDLRDIHTGEANDNNIHMSLHEITSTESEVDKLLKAVAFEPCHGKFFLGYPWYMYGLITGNLRYILYDVLELESCLHSEIQAPLHLRHILEDELKCIGKECAHVFRKLGESMRTMRRVHGLHPLQQAEEGALLLQHKIAKLTSSVLRGAESEIAGKDKLEDVIEEEAYDAATLGTPQPPVQRSDNNTSTESVKSKRRPRLEDGHEDFLQRRETMKRQWDTTVQRVSALSLIKFAALLIGLVIKARFVVATVKELEIRARFEDGESSFADYTQRPGNQQV